MRVLSIRIQMLVVLMLGMLYCACVRNPVTGKRQLVLLSEGQEISMGQESHPEVLSEFGIVENKELQEYCSRIGSNLAKVSHRPHLPWHLSVGETLENRDWQLQRILQSGIPSAEKGV